MLLSRRPSRSTGSPALHPHLVHSVIARDAVQSSPRPPPCPSSMCLLPGGQTADPGSNVGTAAILVPRRARDVTLRLPVGGRNRCHCDNA